MNRFAAAALILVLGASSCDEMAEQARPAYAGKSSLFADRTSLQAPPEGTIARDDPAFRAALDHRPPMSLELLQRGRERFAIFCAPCHDKSGYGQGIVPSRGFPQPPSFHIERLRRVPSSYFVDVISHGHGVMYSYADRVSASDRWAIAAYIRALQLSQDAPLAAVPDAERARLEGAGR